MIAASRVRQIGNSDGLTLPRMLLEALGWQRGDVLLLRAAGDGRLTVEKQHGTRPIQKEPDASNQA
jgi:antitoxin component of MazEF toxin-antitoxin module